ncbi:hypothetical protein [Streptomyces cinereoruber]|uniref:hypothetical protein n=1 Tax=Streptomyces cinereoruber TaxID=67260 RepID=UPI003639490F
MAKEHCEKGVLTPPPPAENPCAGIVGEARDLCEKGVPGYTPGPPVGADGYTGGASEHVRDLADWLLTAIRKLIAPDKAWAPETVDSALYSPFLWLGQNLAVALFICVVVVCGLTAWQGVPRLRQMGASTGWTLAAVAGMASVPGIVHLLHQAVSAALRRAYDGGEGTLLDIIRQDMQTGGDAHPLGLMFLMAALCVALAFAALVYMVRQPAILVLVCIAPLILASLARGGDMQAVKMWTQRLLGLLFAPMVLLLLTPIAAMVKGELVMDIVLLVAADLLMLRMIMHGVPWIGPRVARATRAMVERQTDNRVVRAVVRVGVPDMYEQETTPRGPRVVDTPSRSLARDGSVVLAAYGLPQRPQPGRLTTESAAKKIKADAERTAHLTAARRAARAAHDPAPGAPARPAAPGGAPAARPAAPAPAGGAAPVRPVPPAPPRPSGGTPPTP